MKNLKNRKKASYLYGIVECDTSSEESIAQSDVLEIIKDDNTGLSLAALFSIFYG